jgi:hypothetical protein
MKIRTRFRKHLASTDMKFSVLLILCSFPVYLIVNSNPGYFSHDEFQRSDFLVEHGYKQYFDNLSSLDFSRYESFDFGFPFRPFSFTVQGLISTFTLEYPVLVHTFSAFTSSLVGVVLFLVIRQFHFSGKHSFLISLLFLASPLSLLATGWTAALMDQWFVFFILLALSSAIWFIKTTKIESQIFSLFLIPIMESLALLSKETAIVGPAIVFALFFITKSWKKIIIIGFVWAIPVIGYLWLRFDSLLLSFNPSHRSPYSASITNVPDNLLAYFAFPFAIETTELINIFLVPFWFLWMSVILHLFLIIVLWKQTNFKITLAYLFGYFVFLIPVLTLATPGSHYMYASAIPLAIAVGFLLTRSNKIKFFAIALIFLLSFHSFFMQKDLYETGLCMEKIATSAESAYLSAGKPLEMYISVSPNAKGYIAMRLFTARDRIGSYSPVSVIVENQGRFNTSSTAQALLDENCIVSLKPF